MRPRGYGKSALGGAAVAEAQLRWTAAAERTVDSSSRSALS